MATDRESKLLAAADVVEVDGKEFKLRPIVAQHLCDLEQEALRCYKRQFLQTYAENADLIGDGDGKELVRQKMDEAAQWDLSNLPQKDAYDASRVPISKKLVQWIEKEFGELPKLDKTEEKDKTNNDQTIRSLLSTALDSGKIKPDEVKEKFGALPRQGRVRYDTWWVTASWEGMISFVLTSARYEHPKMSKKEIGNWPFSKLVEASRKVEQLTSASMGNM